MTAAVERYGDVYIVCGYFLALEEKATTCFGANVNPNWSVSDRFCYCVKGYTRLKARTLPLMFQGRNNGQESSLSKI